MCENVQLFCALCRVGIYSLCRRLCCKGPTPVRPNFSVLCLGLANAGKSSLLAVISGDSLHKIEPTVGFSIKALMFEDCILEVKELGGSDAVRPYWERYFQTFQGMMFVVNSASGEEELELAKTELHKALGHASLRHLPLLVLANYQDQESARSAEEVLKFLDLEAENAKRVIQCHGVSISDKESVKHAFQEFNKVLLDNLETRIRENSSGDFNRV